MVLRDRLARELRHVHSSLGMASIPAIDHLLPKPQVPTLWRLQARLRCVIPARRRTVAIEPFLRLLLPVLPLLTRVIRKNSVPAEKS